MTSFVGLLFDLDDTLYSRRAAFASWLDAYLHGTLGLTDAAEIAQVQEIVHALDRNGYGSKQAIFERLHTLYPTLPGEPSRSLETFFAEFLTHVQSEAETETLLDTLADAQIPFGVITSGSTRQWRKWLHSAVAQVAPLGSGARLKRWAWTSAHPACLCPGRSASRSPTPPSSTPPPPASLSCPQKFCLSATTPLLTF